MSRVKEQELALVKLTRGGFSLVIFLFFLSLFFNSDFYFSSSCAAEETSSSLKIHSLLESHYRKTKALYRQKNYDAALAECEKGLEVEQNNQPLLELKKLINEKLTASTSEQSTTLISSTKQGVRFNKLIRSAKIAYRQKKYEDAFRDARQAQQLDADNEEARHLIQLILEKKPELADSRAASVGEISQIETQSVLPSETQSLPAEKIQPAVAPESGSVSMDLDNITFKSYNIDESLPLNGIPLTLEQCIMIARANSLSIKIAREEAALARWKMAPARRALWPSFDAFWKETSGTTTGQDFTGRELALEFQKPLITWGKTKALYLQSKLNWEISKRNLQKEVTELDFKVEQAYFILANAIADYDAVKSLKTDAEKDMKLAEERFKRELTRELEYLKARTKADEIDYRLGSAQKDLILAELTMAQILDSRSPDPFTVKSRLGLYEAQTTLEQCTQLALSNRSDLIVNQLLMEYNKLGQKVAKGDYKWNVNLEGSIGMNGENFITDDLEMSEEYFVGVKVTKPFGAHTLEDNFLTQQKIPGVGQTTDTQFTSNTVKWYFWNNSTKISMKESDIKYLKSIDEYIKKRNSIIFEVKKNYYEYLKSKQQLSNNRKKITVAEEELKIAVARLGLNEILDSELMEAKDKLSRAKSEFGQALTGYYTSVANLNKTIGLTDYFDLKRGLQETSSAHSSAWQGLINEPGEIGSLPSTDGYQEIIQQLEGNKKSWWQSLGSSKRKAAEPPTTTRELVETTTDEGVQLYKEGKYPEAKSKLEAALALDSTNSKAQSYLRKTKIRLGEEVDSTGPHLNFSERSGSSDTNVEDAIQAYREGRYQAAEEMLVKALENNPNDRRAQTYLKRTQAKLSETHQKAD